MADSNRSRPQYASGGDLYTHYGSPVITSKNNVIVPIKTEAGGGFMVNAFQGSNGKLLWTLATDYVLPSYNWIPPVGMTLTPGDAAVAVAGAGGTVFLRRRRIRRTGRLPASRFSA